MQDDAINDSVPRLRLHRARIAFQAACSLLTRARGPCKFQDFEKSLPGISASTLSARLKKLEEHGIIERKLNSDHPPRGEYALTAKGWTLGPVMKMLREWGSKNAT
jgi:DNA-binding HxlR family transcriptional regulator